jgi:hypothetical protein
LTADRDRPGHYLAILKFDSPNEAMKQSNKRLRAFLEGPPRFHNLDIVRVLGH